MKKLRKVSFDKFDLLSQNQTSRLYGGAQTEEPYIPGGTPGITTKPPTYPSTKPGGGNGTETENWD